MKNTLTLLITSSMILCGSILARTIYIPGDYPTIQAGINAAMVRDTVLISPGIYYENLQFRGRDIVLASHFVVNHDPAVITGTIIHGRMSGSVVKIDSNESMYTVIEGLTIQNGYSREGGGIYCESSFPVIRNNIITDNETSGYGGGIACTYGAMPIIEFNWIVNNRASTLFGRGGGISCNYSSSATIMNNLIIGNSALEQEGGGIQCTYSNPFIANCTFSRNIALTGGALFCFGSHINISNCILWGDSAIEDGNEVYAIYDPPLITYSDIEGGYQGAGNLNSDPLFRDISNDDYHLMYVACGDSIRSPCVDAGAPNIVDQWLDCLRGLGDTLSDLGAYGGASSLWPSSLTGGFAPLPHDHILIRNHPNPFNAHTIIECRIPTTEYARLSIFDILGRRIEILFDGIIPEGEHRLFWNASSRASGVYFARIETKSRIGTVEMLLLK